jgi:hypothetical protein
VRTYEVWLVDLGAGEVRFGKRVCFHQDRTVEEFKRLLAELLPAVAKTEQACQQYVVNHMEELRRKKAEEQSQQPPTIANGDVDEKEGKQKVDNEMLSQVAGTSAADHPIQMVPADDAEEAVVPEIPVDRENSVPDNAGSAENDDKKGQEAEAAQASDNEMDKGSNCWICIFIIKILFFIQPTRQLSRRSSHFAFWFSIATTVHPEKKTTNYSNGRSKSSASLGRKIMPK